MIQITENGTGVGSRPQIALGMLRTMVLHTATMLVGGVQISLSRGTGVWIPQPCGCGWGNRCWTRLPSGDHSFPSTTARQGKDPGLVGGQSTNQHQALPTGHPAACSQVLGVWNYCLGISIHKATVHVGEE